MIDIPKQRTPSLRESQRDLQAKATDQALWEVNLSHKETIHFPRSPGTEGTAVGEGATVFQSWPSA